MPSQIKDQYPHGLFVAKEQCEHCLFSDSPVVGKARVREILRECRRDDVHFLCHVPATKNDDTEVVCRGFYDNATSQLIRIMQRINAIVFVDMKGK